jgi:hypothetical protein
MGVVCGVITLIVMSAVSVQGVLFQSTGDPGYNTNAPSGALTDSGWQYQGIWDTSHLNFPVGKFLGTPIAPRFFVSTKSAFGQTNNVLVLNGVTFHPIAQYNSTNSDLIIWQVAETFPSYAPLYASSDESNKPVVMFGRGTQRGSPVVVSGQTNGWQWGTSDSVQRWGENDVSSIRNGGVGVGDLLRCTFDAGGGSNECATSHGDEGGGVFIQTNGVWELAGVNYTSDGPFSNAVDNTMFFASLLDARGLYELFGSTNWVLITGSQPVPSGSYSTRISAHLAEINSVIDFSPGSDLQITGVQIVGDNVQVSFSTGSTNRLYVVQSTGSLVNPSWTTLTNNVPGTGGTVSVVDSNAAVVPTRFYRVGLER